MPKLGKDLFKEEFFYKSCSTCLLNKLGIPQCFSFKIQVTFKDRITATKVHGVMILFNMTEIIF